MSALFAMIVAVALMVVIIAVRYLATSGLFAFATSLVRPGLYADLNPQIRREIGWSLLSAIIYGVPAGVIAWGWIHRDWTLLYADISTYPLWYWPLSIAIYLFLHDTWFYWTHRLLHRPNWFRAAHAVHHASRPPTAWAAMSFHPYEAVIGAVLFPILVFVIPIHIGALALVATIMTVMAVTNHMGWEVFPKWIVHSRAGNWLITASHHQRHHDEYRCNYGLYFRFWDRLCKTDKGLAERYRAETPQGPQASQHSQRR